MSAQPENFERYRKRQSASLLFSVLLHVGIATTALVVFSFFRSPPEDEPLRRGSIVLTSLDENQQEEFLAEEDFAEEQMEESAAAAAAPSIEAAPAMELPQIDSLPGPPPVEPSPNAAEMANESLTDAPTHQFELTEAELDAIRKEQRRLKSRRPKGDPTSINVFDGTQMSGRRFVFILDRSQSMGNDNGGLGVLSRATNELSAAISNLEPNHEFQIVAYHDQTVTISKRQMLPAIDKNKALVKPFLQRLTAYGGTEHHYGIGAALAFRPDSVVLMTDGGYPGLSATELQLIRKMAGKAEFHCIQFGLGPQQESANFMTRLSTQCNGTFRYIDVRDWDE